MSNHLGYSLGTNSLWFVGVFLQTMTKLCCRRGDRKRVSERVCSNFITQDSCVFGMSSFATQPTIKAGRRWLALLALALGASGGALGAWVLHHPHELRVEKRLQFSADMATRLLE